MATQNISAKAVDRVQVFETKTEQQQLTGMSTGNEGKTVNIKLKEDAKKGAFGKLNTGTDFNKYFDAKALYNKFVGKRKFSLYGTRSNVNAGSLNWEDRQKIGLENDAEFDELSGYYFSFGGSDDFNDWNLRGLPDAWPTLPSPTPEPTPAPTPIPTPVVEPTPEPTEEPEAEPAELAIRVTKLTASVRRGATASITIKTAAKARCSIDVEYKSGSSTAKGLGDKTANSSGLVTWSWKVGSNTTRGSWPIYIDCSRGDQYGSISREFTVK
jgi:hypothetical protein